MGKRQFGFMMCGISLLNGACFYRASLGAMQQGISGVDNQAALLFIPALWVIAAAVLVAINVSAAVYGRAIRRDHRICPLDIFRLRGLRGRELAGRITFLVVAALLVLFGYGLFAAEVVWSAAYALSGGMLLVCLYLWGRAGMRRSQG